MYKRTSGHTQRPAPRRPYNTHAGQANWEPHSPAPVRQKAGPGPVQQRHSSPRRLPRKAPAPTTTQRPPPPPRAGGATWWGGGGLGRAAAHGVSESPCLAAAVRVSFVASPMRKPACFAPVAPHHQSRHQPRPHQRREPISTSPPPPGASDLPPPHTCFLRSAGGGELAQFLARRIYIRITGRHGGLNPARQLAPVPLINSRDLQGGLVLHRATISTDGTTCSPLLFEYVHRESKRKNILLEEAAVRWTSTKPIF